MCKLAALPEMARIYSEAFKILVLDNICDASELRCHPIEKTIHLIYSAWQLRL